MIVETELNTLVVIDENIQDNLSLNIDEKNNKITLKLSKSKFFSNLYYKNIILGFISKEINALLEKHLKEMNKKEVFLNEQR